ncbi:MAG: UDP-N-acetylmuramyl-tripeptide synthetase [Myxococcales bacterium]|nr:UDP-N-acetylmuramyl-tripeptide synthetase [Myxococcales bacterium]
MKRVAPSPPPWHTNLTTVGVTGTNGKTTTTTFVAAALRALGHPVPRVTTVGRFLDEEPLSVAEGYAGFLETMRRGIAAGATHAAAEYTSEALGVGGLALAWPCKVAVFTNLTRDHFDAHGSAEHYLASKAQLFAHLLPGGAAVLNASDPAGELLGQVLPEGTRLLTYGSPARGEPWCAPTVTIERAEPTALGTEITLRWSGALAARPASLRIRAVGAIFAENAVAALLAAEAAGAPFDEAAQCLATCPAPPGRFEVVAEQPCVVVDYAHTPDALARTLQTARTLATATGGKLTVVFGAGGDRDKGKRPQMGAAATAADRVLLTSDNPRSEKPADIARAIRAGIGRGPEVIVELDRRRAIETAVARAAPEDVVVIAGKGHEEGQIVAGRVSPFSDVEVVRTSVRLR